MVDLWHRGQWPKGDKNHNVEYSSVGLLARGYTIISVDVAAHDSSHGSTDDPKAILGKLLQPSLEFGNRDFHFINNIAHISRTSHEMSS